MTLRVFAGGLATETNVFAPLPTGLADYEVAGPEDADEVRDHILGGTTFTRYRQAVDACDCAYVQGTYAFALPAGITPRAAYETLRDRLLGEIERALPLDAVLLTLHGAQVAEGYVDCETDLVSRVREIVGKARIGVLLDLHCDIPKELVDAADVIVVYKEYPHIDIDDRAEELATLVLDAAAGRTDPRMAFFDCRMMGLYRTPIEPMRAFVDAMTERERDGVLSVSLGHSFPWGDSPSMGARMLVVTDGDDELAQATAEEFGRRFFDLRHEVSLWPVPMAEALDRAFAPDAKPPVVVADVADNAGGGAASDSTFVLRELLDRGVESVALGMLWDPIAVRQAFGAGVGATLELRLGGKMGPNSGEPLDLTVTVHGLVPELVQRWPQTSGHIEIPCGETAWLRAGGVDVIVGSARHQVLGLEIFTAFGIEPADRRVLVVKSANHFYAAFAPIAGEVIYMSAPGTLGFDFPSIPYRYVDPNKYPWVDDPFGQA